MGGGDDLRRLVKEKEGLTRVATIVAEGVPAAELYAALAQEVVHALEVPAVSLVRYEADRSTVVLSSVNAPDFPVGGRSPHDGSSLSGRILDTGRAARIESELRSEAGVPIVVDGEVWGLIRAAANGPTPLRSDVEAGLHDFTGLMATAISKTESSERLRRVVAEQAALRSIATLVAQGAAPADVLSSVAQEVARVLDVSAVSVVRFESAWSVVVASFNDPGFPVGSRWPLDGPSLNATVFETGEPSQIDYSELPGPVADAARSGGIRVGVGVPIVVEGKVWGMMAVGQRQRRDALPAFAGSYSGRIVLSTASPQETQARLAAFTELVATAISNAQAHDDLRGLALEQAALRRVATLVARDAPPGEVFAAVAMEVGTLLDTDITVVGRYDDDGAATAIGSWSAAPGGVPVGTRSEVGGHNVLTLVAETEKPARVDGYDDASGEAADIARNHGWRSSIAAPIIVEGRVWGVMLVATQRPEPFPAGAEERLAAFTDLVSTALSNAQAHDEVRRSAAEQATLRRIATLVARGVEADDLFAAVAEETAATFDAITAVMRFEHDPPGVIVVGVSKETGIPIGTRWEFAEGMSSAQVYSTGRSARASSPADYWSSLSGPVAEAGQRLGIVSQVSCPIVVEGGVWGVITVNAGEELPRDTELRLEKFTDLVTTAIANAEGKSELAASRRRIVAAADEARRQIERDLHDGIQQQLIALTFRARAMTRQSPDELPGVVRELAEGLRDVSDELREVARGIHPTILTEAGLGPALRALARRSTVPVDVDVRLDKRLPTPIEAAAYYIVSEALTNVAKHAHANAVQLKAAQDNGTLTLEVRDDGIGGVDASLGSGILGLTDRAEALGGWFALESPPGRGTTISVELPIATPAAP
jgi:signal transduction histidine kinase